MLPGPLGLPPGVLKNIGHGSKSEQGLPGGLLRSPEGSAPLPGSVSGSSWGRKLAPKVTKWALKSAFDDDNCRRNAKFGP